MGVGLFLRIIFLVAWDQYFLKPVMIDHTIIVYTKQNFHYILELPLYSKVLKIGYLCCFYFNLKAKINLKMS